MKNRCILVERRIAACYDGEGNKLMQYLPEFIHENLAVSVESEIHQLIATIDPPAPAGTRYKRFLDWKASLLGKPCGVYAYTVYPTQGQPQGIPGPSGDSAGKPEEVVGAVCKFDCPCHSLSYQLSYHLYLLLLISQFVINSKAMSWPRRKSRRY